MVVMTENKKKLNAADLASLLRSEINLGQYARNDKLPTERDMANTYGVSRGTVREALTKLMENGLVEIKHGSGTYVTFDGKVSTPNAIQSANPLELIDARFALEPHICRLAVLHGRREDFDKLTLLCDKMDSSLHNTLEFSAADTEFHHTLVQCTRNVLLIWIIDQINSVRGQSDWKRMRGLTLNPTIIDQYNNQHRKILEALYRREPEAAANSMKDHLETVRLSLTRAAAA